MKPKISVMIHTASFDNFLQNQNIQSYFESVTDCLSRQTFKAFEFIYIDTFYETNKDRFNEIISKLPFQVKHVPVHVNHRYWYDLGYVYISAAKNTGILYADGDLLITFDDSEFFPESLLATYWKWFNNGIFMHGYHKRMTSIKTENGKPTFPIEGELYINDHRAGTVSPQNATARSYGSSAYAGSSFSLVDALKINGFNEKMDGCKSLEDCDFGARLEMLGKHFIIDYEGFLYILDHQSYGIDNTNWKSEQTSDGQITKMPDKIVKKIDNFIAIENYGMCRCAIELFDLMANVGPLTQKHFDIIQRETLKYREFDPLAEENKDKMEIWLKTPNFDLVRERKELRATPDWQYEN